MSGVGSEYSRKRPSKRSAHAADADVLEFRVVEDAVLRAFAAAARLLDAAERRHLGGDDAGVEAHDAVLERLGNAPAARQIARVQVGGESELGVVGHADGLRLGLEAE